MNPISLLFLLFSLSIRPALSTRPESDPDSLRLDLIRHPSDPLTPRPDRIRDLVRHDRARHGFISATLRQKKLPECYGSTPPPPPEEARSFAMPMTSGAYTGTGQYFVRVRVGTPAHRFLLVADTGSDLTWVNCRYQTKTGRVGSRTKKRCENSRIPCGSGRRRRQVFRADLSRSFRPISCSSELCKTQLPFALTTCPSPLSPCAYDYGYADGSSAQGFFGNESATISLSNGRKKKLKGLVIGCTSSSVGSSFRSSDGVLGLGHSNTSFASRAASRYGGRFSYCLVDHLSPKNATSYLIFGPNRRLRPSLARQTELLVRPMIEPFYGVGIAGISVAGEVMRIPSAVWSFPEGGGTIVDSGSSLTFLAKPAYEAVTFALSRRLVGIPRVDVDSFSFCYNWTNVGEREIPTLVVHFNGSARLEPPAKSYLIDVEEGVKCIGLMSAAWPGQSTIGNIMQQEHLWEFDIQNRRLRFQRSTCTY